MRFLFLSAILLTLPAGCKEETTEEKTDAVVETSLLPPPPREVAMEVYDSAAAVVSETTETTLQPKIIKTGTLRFESDNLDQSFAAVQQAVMKHKATVQNDESGKNYNHSFRNITVRVPNTSFDAFIADISKGVKHFDRKEISAEDVTEEYVDVEARLKAKRLLEQRYLELLSKAAKVSEMLEIERELSNIREEIEAKEGRLKYLQSQVAMSTVRLEMYTNNASESGATVSYFGKMWNALQEGFNNIATFFIRLLHVWPFILIFVVVIGFIRRRFKKKTT
ncbi:DUF4349 domain-containing protein [Flavobacterium suncheonense]|uniref:DUF4349 domain-containing protein n=1 Tax=Flavobacterium suncheonense GH29-5 = DSM 17707 TaxID=1121899 RepID=A0A0A2MLH4_9FLAO|nr:DUF4349 domain-containing protein [Flavobacterium suncheonense]KGO89130.1 hypothetical protein Q764_09490 [Flavobacterium suncheonense GH29-5 = DSM 17707]